MSAREQTYCCIAVCAACAAAGGLGGCNCVCFAVCLFCLQSFPGLHHLLLPGACCCPRPFKAYNNCCCLGACCCPRPLKAYNNCCCQGPAGYIRGPAGALSLVRLFFQLLPVSCRCPGPSVAPSFRLLPGAGLSGLSCPINICRCRWVLDYLGFLPHPGPHQQLPLPLGAGPSGLPAPPRPGPDCRRVSDFPGLVAPTQARLQLLPGAGLSGLVAPTQAGPRLLPGE